VDLRNIHSPIVVFCSKADNITPPQQALDWILDLYESVDDIRTYGQTIVYALHESIGHLGIFVSSSVAKKEHDQFASNIDLIDALPPGLYEAVMTPKADNDPAAALISGDYLVRFETRTLEDIRALGTNSAEDERRFAAAARVSEINLGLYRTFLQPWIRAWTTESSAEWMRRLHPERIQYDIFSRTNPLIQSLEPLAAFARNHRLPVSKDNPFWQAQAWFSDWMERSLDAYRDVRDHSYEALFHSVYGSPLLQALAGLKASDQSPRRKPGQDADHQTLIAQRMRELKEMVGEGGPREAAIRALLYIRMPEGVADERGFNLLRRMREDTGKGLTLAAFKQVLREQYFMLLLDERRAVEMIPTMLDRDPELAARMASHLRKLIGVVGIRSDVARARLDEVERMFKAGSSRRSGARTEVGESDLEAPTPARVHAKHA